MDQRNPSTILQWKRAEKSSDTFVLHDGSSGSAPVRAVLETPEGWVIKIRTPCITIGRDLRSHLCIKGRDTVSRNHAILAEGEDGWLLKDLSSKNGSFVNREPVTRDSPRLLSPGDEIRLGRDVVFTFHPSDS